MPMIPVEAPPAPVPEKGTVALEGSLEEFSLAEILGLVERAGQTGALEVRGRSGDGTLYLRDGGLCAGEAADVTGPVDRPEVLRARLLDVCFVLLRSGVGTFRFVPGAEPPWPAGPPVEVGAVLGIAQRLAEAWDRIEVWVPSVDDRPALNDDLRRDTLTLDRLGYRVLRAIDGSRTVRQIARALDLAAVETAAVVADLVESGAARIAVPAGAPTTGVPAASASLAGDRSREREELVIRAGLSEPDAAARKPLPAVATAEPGGPEPSGPGDAGGGPDGTDVIVDDPEPATYVTRDRGALLRLFSALRDGEG